MGLTSKPPKSKQPHVQNTSKNSSPSPSERSLHLTERRQSAHEGRGSVYTRLPTKLTPSTDASKVPFPLYRHGSAGRIFAGVWQTEVRGFDSSRAKGDRVNPESHDRLPDLTLNRIHGPSAQLGRCDLSHHRWINSPPPDTIVHRNNGGIPC